MQAQYLQVRRTARYLVHGEAGPHFRHLWFVCHGYGQLAEYFLQKFTFLSPQEHMVVAPEALSRFYQQGFQGRIGATWMTKHDREQEISDYIYYLNQLYQHITEPLTPYLPNLRITVLGFSQGVATASRWVCDEQVSFDRFVAWAGSLAHDLETEKMLRVLPKKECYFVYGNQDQLISPDQMNNYREKIRASKLPFELIEFEGKHELNQEVLARLAEAP